MTRLLVLTAAILLVSSSVWAQCDYSHWDSEMGQLSLTAWSERDFTICFDQSYVDDIELARWWLIKSLRVGRNKYGVHRPTYNGKSLHTKVFFPPHPTTRTRPGYVSNACCDEREDVVYSEIHYLAPGAWPNWKLVGICWDRMVDYHAHYIMHEMMHTIQFSVNNIVEDAPRDSWTMEALAEYDAYHYSSTWNRNQGIEYLLELADYSHRHRIWYSESLDGTAQFGAESRYVGGAVVMMFLADKFGEGIHNEMLRRDAREVFRGSRAITSDTLEEFKEWFNGKPEIVTQERCLKSLQ